MTSFNSFLKINDVHTHVACWGRWVEENEPDEVIIMIPGNPGLPGFFYSFLEELHKNTNLPVWILGHAGHEEPDWSSGFAPIQPIKGNEELFNLEGQYKHKAEFIKKYTKPTTKVHLFGSSIGGWISMELLRHEELKDRLVSVNLLLPTLERMATSPNGVILNKFIRRVPFVFLALVSLFNLLPGFIRLILIRIYLFFCSVPPKDILIKTLLKCLQRTVIEKVLFMAFDEMDKVVDINRDIFLNEQSRIKIIYGDNDGWSPAHYFEEYRRQLPDYYIRNVPYRHAFSLNAYTEMASISADLIASK